MLIIAMLANAVFWAFVAASTLFVGAAIAIGGQHKVNDYLTGLTVHFEDRYGVGDEIVVEVGWSEPVHAIVDHIGRKYGSTPEQSAANRAMITERAAATLRISRSPGVLSGGTCGSSRNVNISSAYFSSRFCMRFTWALVLGALATR